MSLIAAICRRERNELPRRTFLHLAAGAAALPAIPRTTRAQAYPTRPVTVPPTLLARADEVIE
jgi:hypothetical protein